MILRRAAPLLLALLVPACALAGCGSRFTYKHSTPLAAEPRFEMKVSVLAFEDATGAPGTSSDPLRSIGTVNLAKRPWKNLASNMPQLTGTFLAKALTMEIVSSGLFRSAAFRKNPPSSETPHLLVRGSILRAEFSNPKGSQASLLLELGAEARLFPEDRLLWSDRIVRSEQRFPGDAEADHLKLNQLLQKAFGDIRRHIAGALEAEGLAVSPGPVKP